MEEVLKMSPKERERKAIFEMVKRGCLTLKQAARQNNLSYRQARRVFQAYLKMGDAGLIHKNRDQQSNRKHPHQESIINCYKEKYEGFGPTLACEDLQNEGYHVDHETLVNGDTKARINGAGFEPLIAAGASKIGLWSQASMRAYV